MIDEKRLIEALASQIFSAEVYNDDFDGVVIRNLLCLGDVTAEVMKQLDEQPAVEAVPKSYADQIRWERDIAIEQLNEIGCQFGQKMDEVKKKLEATSFVKCKDCKYFCDGYPNLLNADGLCENVDCLVDLDDFCSFGERKENEINRCI